MGASAGGIPPIQRVISALPDNFPAAVLVAIHTAAEGPRLLPDVFSRMSSLPVAYAVDGERIRKSRIYVAPPDRHLLLDNQHMRVTTGPRENRHRPAIDPLFRSAARAYGPRVVAILFSGLLDDGTAGLSVVTRHGGVTIVQDPDEARFASMPENALKNDSPRYVLPVRKIAPTLLELVANGRRSRARGGHPDSTLDKKVKIAEIDMTAIERDKPGVPSVYSCPECNGTLWEIREEKVSRFRCRVGHAYGAESLLASKNEELESALWTALRTLEEKAALHRRLSEDAARRQNSRVATIFRQMAEDFHQQAQTIRHVLLQREQTPLTGTDD
jgi:two-component system, chemotaxis family, protein-glutamate methylesterase/glutaminase